MKIGSAFPSKYLKASDIPDGQFIRVTMDHVAIENVAGNDDPNDEKPVLYFVGKQKGMVLNKTNSTTISSGYGEETDDWRGKDVLLYATETSFQGKTMPCLRVKMPRPSAQPSANGGHSPSQMHPARTREPATSTISNEPQFKEDDIPF